MRKRWFGASGKKVPEIVVEGDPALPLAEALVVDDVMDVAPLREAHERGIPVVVRAGTEEEVKAALSRPEVASVVVPRDRPELLELDLTELTYE